MTIENFTNVLLPEDVVHQISYLSTLFQAIGGLVIAYIVFNIINIIHNQKKEKELKKMRMLLEDIDKKLSRKNKK